MLNIHWIPQHYDPAKDMPWFRTVKPRFIKVVWDGKPPYADMVRELGAGYVYRDYLMSENWHKRDLVDEATARQIGLNHAEYLKPAYAELRAQGIPANQIWFEGLNELKLWTPGERPRLAAAYYGGFLDGLHGFGARGSVGNFGVGWPGNSHNGGGQQGAEGSPPLWDFWKPVVDRMITNADYPDFLSVHEYWAFNGPQENWKWWGGRFLHCPYDVPILVTECGIDGGVIGQWEKGWASLPGNSRDEKAARYVDELWWYFAECAKDRRVQGCFPFTYDGELSDWSEFNLKDDVFKQQSTIQIAQVGIPQPQKWNGSGTAPPPPPPPPVTDFEVWGIDVSDHQGGNIDWQAVKDSGATFAMIRASVGRWNDGNPDVVEDKYFDRNWPEAGKVGLFRAPWHYLHSKPFKQALKFAEVVSGLVPEMGYYLDVEENGLTKERVSLAFDAFDELLGCVTDTYTRASLQHLFEDDDGRRHLWVASPGKDAPVLPRQWDDWEFWQYGQRVVPGISTGPVDVNVFNGTMKEFLAKYGGEYLKDDILEAMEFLNQAWDKLEDVLEMIDR